MQISVMILADETILVNTDLSDTIYDVKTRIHDELCVPRPDSASCSMARSWRKDAPIADYNIEEESTVQLALHPKPPREVMQIFLKAPNGRLSLAVKSSDTVEDVKKRINVTWGIPPQSQLALIFDGRQLEGGYGLDSYGVCVGSTLHLTLHGSGWMLISAKLPIARKNPIIPLMCIIFRGGQLKDGLTLTDRGVVENSLLDVILRLRGTNCPSCAGGIARQQGEDVD
ncbi:hypothetical protein VPH35_127000 [Triticum aestivum]